MLIIQKALDPVYKKVTVKQNIGDEVIGYKGGEELQVLVSGDTLLYTNRKRVKGFEKAGNVKPFKTRGTIQATIPKALYHEAMGAPEFLRVYYTPIGIFIKPYNGKEFKKYAL